jgi:hypothetical protein
LAEELDYWRRQRCRWLVDIEAGDCEDGDEPTLRNGIAFAEHKLAELARFAEREVRAMAHPGYPPARPREDLSARFAAAKWADLVDLAETMTGQTAVKSGSRYRLHCPLHRDRDPSLTIYEPGRGWHCFSCGKGGDAVSFVMELEGLNAVEALRRVEQLCNVYPESWRAVAS